jgi:hypothetical protein
MFHLYLPPLPPPPPINHHLLHTPRHRDTFLKYRTAHCSINSIHPSTALSENTRRLLTTSQLVRVSNPRFLTSHLPFLTSHFSTLPLTASLSHSSSSSPSSSYIYTYIHPYPPLCIHTSTLTHSLTDSLNNNSDFNFIQLYSTPFDFCQRASEVCHIPYPVSHIPYPGGKGSSYGISFLMVVRSSSN